MLDKDIIDALIQHQTNGYRASTKVVNELQQQFSTSSNVFASKLRRILDELTESEKIALVSAKYTTDLLKELKTSFDDWYQSIAVSIPETFAVSAVALATYEANFISKLYGDEKDISGTKVWSTAKKTPVVGGALFDELFKDVAESARKQAMYAIRSGIDSGLTNQQIISQIIGKRTKVGDKYEYVGGIVDKTKNQIDAEVRTARTHVAQVAYEETFAALGYDYLKFVGTIDGRTTVQCGSLDGTVWQKGDSSIRRPPLHRRCRSILVGVDKDGNIAGNRPFVAADKPVSKIPKDQRDGIIGQIDANTTFKSWFAQQDADFQKNWLGKKRYELYKNGGLTLDKFVDPLGREYTIKELRALDDKIFKRLGLE